jgi:hypothetical protein
LRFFSLSENEGVGISEGIDRLIAELPPTSRASLQGQIRAMIKKRVLVRFAHATTLVHVLCHFCCLVSLYFL